MVQQVPHRAVKAVAVPHRSMPSPRRTAAGAGAGAAQHSASRRLPSTMQRWQPYSSCLELSSARF